MHLWLNVQPKRQKGILKGAKQNWTIAMPKDSSTITGHGSAIPIFNKYYIIGDEHELWYVHTQGLVCLCVVW
jgi:hypothetical protein